MSRLIPSKIKIGYEGEINARYADIDISEELKQWPECVPAILHKRHGDAEPHPVNTELRGSVLRWLFSAVDAERVGWGVAQIVFTRPDGEVIGKSRVIQTETARSLEAAGDIPDVVQPWVDPLLAAAAQTQSKAAEARQAADQAAGALKELRDGIASGDFNGKDGFSPIANAERVEDGVKITITDAKGTSTAVVKDGKGGSADVTKAAIDNALGMDVVQNINNKADKKDIPAPYDDTDIRKDVAEIDKAVTQL